MAPNRLVKFAWFTLRYRRSHLRCFVLRLQGRQEDQCPQVERDGLRHRYPNTRGDGSSRSPTSEHLGKDRFHCFLNDRCFRDTIALFSMF